MSKHLDIIWTNQFKKDYRDSMRDSSPLAFSDGDIFRRCWFGMTVQSRFFQYGKLPLPHLLPVKIKSVDFERFICLYASVAFHMGKHPRPVQNASHREIIRRFAALFDTFAASVKV